MKEGDMLRNMMSSKVGQVKALINAGPPVAKKRKPENSTTIQQVPAYYTSNEMGQKYQQPPPSQLSPSGFQQAATSRPVQLQQQSTGYQQSPGGYQQSTASSSLPLYPQQQNSSTSVKL